MVDSAVILAEYMLKGDGNVVKSRGKALKMTGRG